jgi:hypothetical protein
MHGPIVHDTCVHHIVLVVYRFDLMIGMMRKTHIHHGPSTYMLTLQPNREASQAHVGSMLFFATLILIHVAQKLETI